MSAEPQHAQHLHEEQILRLALGTPPGDEESTHLQGCGLCRARIAATRRVIGALSEPAELLEPPAGLWERIRHEIERQDEGERASGDESGHESGHGTGPATTDAAVPAETERAPRSGARRGAARPGASGDPGRQRSQVRSHDRGQGRRRGRLAAAAAAGVLVGAVAGAAGFGLATSGRDDDGAGGGGDPGIEQIDATALEPVAAESMSGQARLERDDQGRLLLAVDVSELPEDGYLEVWLRDADATRLVSLGVLDATTGTLQVPQGIDLADYPVVDISQEHLDGDPTHGGQTLVAGALPSA